MLRLISFVLLLWAAWVMATTKSSDLENALLKQTPIYQTVSETCSHLSERGKLEVAKLYYTLSRQE